MNNSLMMENRQRGSDVISLRFLACMIVAVTIFLSIDPFFAWASFAGGFGVTIFKGMELLAIVAMLLFIPYQRLPIYRLVCAVCVMGLFLFYCYGTGVKGGTTHPLLIGNILVYLFYALTVLVDKGILIRSFGMLRTIFAIILGYTLVIYLLILIGLPIPYTVLQSGEAGRLATGTQYYQNYFGCLLINQRGELLYRFTSVFTEPGVVGTFAGFFLAADGCRMKRNLGNKIFLVSGLLSLSLAFYVMLLLILAMKAIRSGGYRLLVGLAAVVILYFAFINIDFDNQAITGMQERLELTDEGLAGDNRIHEEAEIEYRAFLQSDPMTVLLGYGKPKVNPLTGLSAWQSTASYKESVYCLGFLGYGLMIAWFIATPLLCYRQKDRRLNHMMYSYMIIFILSQYQRPYMKSLFLAYILLAGCLYAQQHASTGRDRAEAAAD